jgi:hypothetical protein
MLGKPSEGFIAFKEKELWGYLDKNKSYAVAIPPIFKEANPFKNGLAMVASPRKAGLEYFIINKQGAVAYKHTGILREGMLPVSNLEGKWGYMDENFTLVIPPQYGYAGAFIHGFAAITEGEFFRFIDKNGNFLNDFLYEEVNAFGDNGLALVKREGSTRYLGKDGQEREISPGGGNATKPLDEAPVMRIAELSRDVVEQQSKAVAVKKDNNPEKYDFVGELIEGLRLVKKKGKVGFVNAEGKPVINTIYENAADFSEGKAAVQLQCKWGFINNYGIIKIPPPI